MHFSEFNWEIEIINPRSVLPLSKLQVLAIGCVMHLFTCIVSWTPNIDQSTCGFTNNHVFAIITYTIMVTQSMIHTCLCYLYLLMIKQRIAVSNHMALNRRFHHFTYWAEVKHSSFLERMVHMAVETLMKALGKVIKPVSWKLQFMDGLKIVEDLH